MLAVVKRGRMTRLGSFTPRKSCGPALAPRKPGTRM